MLDIKGKAKWQSWNERKGMNSNEAKVKYIIYVDQLVIKYA